MQFDRPLAVITPTLDGDVLAALAYRSRVGSTAGQIQYLLGRHSTQGVRLSLARLAEQGVLQRRRAGNSYEYRLNPNHMATPAILALAVARRRLVRRIRALLGVWPTPPSYAALFGPVVRGQMRTDEAINLFVAYPQPAAPPWLAEHVTELAATVRAWTGNDLDVVTMSEHEAPTRTEDDVLVAVRRDGLRVSGHPSWPDHQCLLARERHWRSSA